MIRYSKKLEQDYLTPGLMDMLQNVGVKPMDAYYHIYKSDGTYYLSEHDWIEGISKDEEKQWEHICPTYTLSELLYKLNEWPGTVVELHKGKYAGQKAALKQLIFFKDAPFYFFGYKLESCETGEEINSDEWTCYSEYPLYAAAYLLLKCAGMGVPYDDNISDK